MSALDLLLVIGLIGVAFVAGFGLGRRSRVPEEPMPRQPDATAPRRPEEPSSADAPPKALRKPQASRTRPQPEEVSPRSPAPAPQAPAGSAVERLGAARSWGYQLQGLNVARAAASSFDILVVDYAKDGSDDTALKPAEVARLQQKPDGGRRIVLAYLSIGEAESYRFYWRKEWKRQKPAWLLGENPDWDENYAVCFWDPGWQALLFGTGEAYLDRILAQGFDGIYLDKCDVTEDLKRHERKAAATRTDLDADMVQLVRQIADYARKARPGFLVVMQNAEPLLERPELRSAIDAVAKEELLYGLDKVEKANDADEVTWSRTRLELMRRDAKPVLVVEYLDDAAKSTAAADQLRALGYVPYISSKSRELDRLRDPAPEV